MVTKTLAFRSDGTEITCNFIDENDYNEFFKLVSDEVISNLFASCSLSDIKKIYHAFHKKGVV